MGSMSDAFEVDVLKAATGQTTTILTTTALTNLYVGLFTVTPSDAAGGTEVTGGAYARIQSVGKWGAPTSANPSTVANNAIITFPTATADWGTVVAFGLFTALTVGTLLWWGALGQNKTVSNGDTPSYGVGALVLTLD